VNPGLNPFAAPAPISGMPPLRVTLIPSGAGTFTPLGRTKWMRVLRLGGGGGGGAVSSGGTGQAAGGQASVPVVDLIQKTALSYAYSIGAGGTAGAAAGPVDAGDGGDTTFGSLTSYGGRGGDGVNTGTQWRGSGVGGCSGYGKGGRSPAGSAGTAASGNGAGGGGSCTANTSGGAGTGGLLYIEEY
jgi:hypothetical protein